MTNTSSPPPGEETWERPSKYSVAVIAIVFGLLAWLLHTGKLSVTEGLIGAVMGVLTWVTRGARPPIANKIGKPPSPPTTPEPPPTQPDIGGPRGLPRAALIAGLCALVLAIACAASSIRPAAYGTELNLCVDTAKTKEQSQQCREDVMRRYGRLDAGGDQ